MNTKAFIAYTNHYTEAECLERSIFGFKSVIHYMGDTENIQTYGFLFNYETDELIGPFKAVSKMNIAIDSTAFQGKYPYQVKVNQVGQLLRKKGALDHLKAIGVQVYKTQNGWVLPSHQITEKKAEELIRWLKDEIFAKNEEVSDDFEAFNTLIEDLVFDSSKKALLGIKKLLTFKKRLTYENADKLLIQLRDSVIKNEFPDYEDRNGLLRKSIKIVFLDKKITSILQFDEIFIIRQFEFDVRQISYLPIIFEIIKKL